MTRGLKIILLIVGGVLAIAAIVYFVAFPFFTGATPATNANANLNQNANAPIQPAGNTNQAAVANVPPPAEVSPELQEASVARSVARTFAERLDTYTNQNGLVNLADLQTISTPAVWKYLDGEYRASLVKAMSNLAGYYSVTSTATNTSITVAAADEVDSVVNLQRVEAGAVSKTNYVTLNLKLKNIDGQWLVSWLEWGK